MLFILPLPSLCIQYALFLYKREHIARTAKGTMENTFY
ncbi:hypothetical protein LDG_8992 [Legionella drancourtii LLAP12]|uniref:Uncharacterized protein n=1 Tax=Legionella drancourtii LLAP12 TaxID=658187 RepID=G9EUJ6_9GAMM|nr:hypothetical protein LDG_8992 [Legionella drancourtii LLAP12]